ncbi:MAG: 5-formyltetrahydrofolate cyclo-ligase [Thermofilum sp. ex4484_79]|nr:MAG: 5-formyltetrahydrofolate cyclo-ligase [Thermofilum sp. ex4484_79]
MHLFLLIDIVVAFNVIYKIILARIVFKNICEQISSLTLYRLLGVNVRNYDSDIDSVKKKIRIEIWRTLEEKNIARFPLPIKDRIPNFVGSEKAAYKVINHEIFLKAKVVFCCPDSPQRPIREHVIRSNKILVMATPRLREGFLILCRKYVPVGKERQASTIRGAFIYGRKTEDPPYNIDLKVAGSVAVTVDGRRLGKGGGYSDLEYAILRELGLIDDKTPVITTVHDLQIVDYIPVTKHDVPLDYIFTPTRVIKTNTKLQKPKGLILEELDHKKIEEVPILKKLLRKRNYYNL